MEQERENGWKTEERGENEDEFGKAQRKGRRGLNDSEVEIGREFERVINKYGCQVVDGILPPVGSIIQQLDSLSRTNIELRDENHELKCKLNHFQRQENNHKKLEADFEFIETNLTEELLKLRDENCQLKHLPPHSHSRYFHSIEYPDGSGNYPQTSLESVDSFDGFQCEKFAQFSLHDQFRQKERQIRELKYQVTQSLAQKSKLEEENEHLKFALHISGEEIERMTELNDTLDKTLAKTLKDNQEMSHSMETCRDGRRRKSCPNTSQNPTVSVELKGDGGKGIPLSEVRKIFLERNDLKYQLEIVRQKLVLLEKERRMKEETEKSTLQIPTIESKCTQTEDLNVENVKEKKEEGDGESLQGPVNREPLEKILLLANRSKSLRFRLARWLMSDLYA